MTAKPKRQAEHRSWWDEFLFTRSFAFETALLLEECAARLERAARPPAWTAPPERTHVYVNRLGDSITFHIRTRERRTMNYTVASASGSALTDLDSGLTRVRGEASIGWLYYLNWLVIVILAWLGSACTLWLSSHQMTPSLVCVSLLVPAAITAVMLWHQLSDRNMIIHTIVSALDDGRKSREKRA